MTISDEMFSGSRDFIRTAVSAIRKKIDPALLSSIIMSEEFEPMLRATIALLPPKRVFEKIYNAAAKKDQAVLWRLKGQAPHYLGRVQKHMIRFQKSMAHDHHGVEALMSVEALGSAIEGFLPTFHNRKKTLYADLVRIAKMLRRVHGPLKGAFGPRRVKSPA